MDLLNAIGSEFIGAVLSGRNIALLPLVLLGYAATAGLIWYLKGRSWAYIYVVLIPFLNWTFGKGQLIEVDLVPLVGHMGGPDTTPVVFQPLTVVTGLVFVVRDFVQREMGHRVLVLMALAVGWSFFYAWPVIAVASALAFAISESVDWAFFTFTKYRLSTRIVLSSAFAAPVDTTVFLYGADLARQYAGDPPGTMLTVPNWIFFIIGKMVGAVFVWWMIRRREDRGVVDPHAL